MAKGGQAIYPDLSLYEEIIFLQYHSEIKNKGIKRLFVVENVVPYYKPIVDPTIKLGRHLFWSNFSIVEKDDFLKGVKNLIKMNIEELQNLHGFDLSSFNNPQKVSNKKRVLLRNCVNSDIGLHILESAIASGELSND
jgi:DNA (cytosine-5)-methyltransferase 1